MRIEGRGRIDRAHEVKFLFDGVVRAGHPGDTLASALMASGQLLMGRSFKYHRPRGVLTAGSEDRLVTPESVQRYQRHLDEAGHPTTYWEYEGRNHAFLDSGSSMLLGSSFEQDAPAALDVMIKFLDGVFPRQPFAPPLKAISPEG